MRRDSLPLLLTAGLVLVLMTGNAHANLVTNGNFGTGDLTGWTNAGNVDVLSDTELMAAYPSAINDTGIPYVADFGGGNGQDDGTISQTFSTTAGTNYSLSFLYGAIGTGDGSEASNQSIQLNLAGDLIPITAVTTTNFATLLNTYTYTFTATGDSFTIGVTDESLSGNDADGILANVDLENIPEPTSLALLGVSLLGLRLGRRKRS